MEVGFSYTKGPHNPDFLCEEVLADFFTCTAEKNPESIVFLSNGKAWTYAEIDCWSHKISQGLWAAGIQRGDYIGLWFPRGVEALVAQIAITRAGAAWVPFDPSAPLERITVCLKDSKAVGLIACHQWCESLPEDWGTSVWSLSDLESIHTQLPAGFQPPILEPDDPAYLIYTSGSTGVPKGIVVAHRNICHTLRAANDRYGIQSQDVVFQGTSLAFDLSLEEIWISFLVGARLFIPTLEMLQDTESLPDIMQKAGVTVLDTVPTLLSLLPRDIPSLRLIILGGEICTPALIERWLKPGRRIINTYGPTETTVVVTCGEVMQGVITIGCPIANTVAYVVDNTGACVPYGHPGELLIGGVGVTRGYLGREELTHERFIKNPFSSEGAYGILYRTGDCVTMKSDGALAFHGRLDDQVKIRGFRIELGDIESILLRVSGIQHAAVICKSLSGDVDRLIAFLVTETHVNFSELHAQALKALKGALPAYMVPSHIECIQKIPLLSSGKVDRKSLQDYPLTPVQAHIYNHPLHEKEQTPTEHLLHEIAVPIFGGDDVDLDGDFFTDLGGHSLLAARFVSAVRKHDHLAHLSLNILYEKRSLRQLAAYLDSVSESFSSHTQGGGFASCDVEPFEAPPLLRRFLCGCAQAISLPIIFSFIMFQWLGIFLVTMWLIRDDTPVIVEWATLCALYMASNVFLKILAVSLKWIILGRTKPGVYPLWGMYYFRCWLVQRILQTVNVQLMQNSPLMRVYLRLLGAKVGQDVMLSSFEMGIPDLLTIGAGSVIGYKTYFANMLVSGNTMTLAPIALGEEVIIGSECTISHGVTLGDYSELGDLTSVRPYTSIGAQERWEGAPGRYVRSIDIATLPKPAQVSSWGRRCNEFIYAVSYFAIQTIDLIPIFPAFFFFDYLTSFTDSESLSFLSLFLIALPTALVLLLTSVMLVVSLRWILIPRRLKPGRFSIHSWGYMQQWIMDLASNVLLTTLASLYATLYMRLWYRLMGVKVGKGTEISTSLGSRYDMITLGDNNFIADEVIIGDPDIQRGWLTLKTIKLADRVFVGNSAVLPPGSKIDREALIGVKSLMPPSLHVKSEETWFGSPALLFPNRQKMHVKDIWTYEPSRLRVCGRALYEAFYISLPTAIFIVCGYLAADRIQGAWLESRYGDSTGIAGIALVAIPLIFTLVPLIYKWLVIGRFSPRVSPMWSFWSMRSESVIGLYIGLLGKASIETLRGTPFLPWILRLYGMKIGKGVWVDTIDITEFDCITVKDFVTLSMGACLQCHLYEDRLMKVGCISLGQGVHVGWGSTVLYDTHIGDYAQLGPLTVVMKGETIPERTSWVGIPPLRTAMEKRIATAA